MTYFEIQGSVFGIVKVNHECFMCGCEVTSFFTKYDYYEWGDSIIHLCKDHLLFLKKEDDQRKAINQLNRFLDIIKNDGNYQ
jgi:hypothetical protein